jgi:hypothetical protein
MRPGGGYRAFVGVKFLPGRPGMTAVPARSGLGAASDSRALLHRWLRLIRIAQDLPEP